MACVLCHLSFEVDYPHGDVVFVDIYPHKETCIGIQSVNIGPASPVGALFAKVQHKTLIYKFDNKLCDGRQVKQLRQFLSSLPSGCFYSYHAILKFDFQTYAG